MCCVHIILDNAGIAIKNVFGFLYNINILSSCRESTPLKCIMFWGIVYYQWQESWGKKISPNIFKFTLTHICVRQLKQLNKAADI